MPTYPKVGTGHNVPLVNLSAIKCRHDPVAPVDREYSVNGNVNDLGLYTCFHFDFAEDEDEYDGTILYSFFLDTDNGKHDHYDVTVYVRNTRMQWQRFNGVAQLPEMGQDAKWENFFPRGIAVYVVDLEPLEEP
jgi:hypothetical protein